MSHVDLDYVGGWTADGSEILPYHCSYIVNALFSKDSHSAKRGLEAK